MSEEKQTVWIVEASNTITHEMMVVGVYPTHSAAKNGAANYADSAYGMPYIDWQEAVNPEVYTAQFQYEYTVSKFNSTLHVAVAKMRIEEHTIFIYPG